MSETTITEVTGLVTARCVDPGFCSKSQANNGGINSIENKVGHWCRQDNKKWCGFFALSPIMETEISFK